jgi:predicted ester cyclase
MLPNNAFHLTGGLPFARPPAGECERWADTDRSLQGRLRVSVDENKALIRRLYDEVFVDWNLGVVDELIGPEFVGHEMPPETPRGPVGFKQFYGGLRSAFPDLRYTVDDVIAEGDKVAVRWTWRCTHEGDFRGIAPTGKQATVTGMAIYRVANGKCAERWVELGLLKLLQQLDAPPTRAAPQLPNATDGASRRS